MENMGKKVTSNVMWNYAERLLAQIVSLLVTVVLSRLIAPEHFGAISIVTIMITFCNIFISNGFGNALVQSKNAEVSTYNAMFYYSFASAVLLYAVIFLTAPLVAYYFDLDILVPVIRVMGLRIVIASLNTIQHAYLVRRLEFKKFFITTFFGTVISAAVGIAMAYAGFGIWALVGQYLTNVTIDTILLYFTCGWKPGQKSDWRGAAKILPFGFKLLLSALIKNIYNEISGLIIGKRFSVTDLAYYSKGKQFPSIVVTNLNSTLSRVLFSAMSRNQDNLTSVRNMLRRSLKINLYIVGPLMAGFALCAPSLVSVVLTDKWLESVPYLQMFSLFFLLKSIQNNHIQAVNAVGRSGITLWIETAGTVFGVVGLIVAIFVLKSITATILVMCLEQVLCILALCIANRKLLNYALKDQIVDFIPTLLVIALMSAVVFAVGVILPQGWMGLLAQSTAGIAIYVILSLVFKLDSFHYMLSIIRSILKKKEGAAK